MLCAVTSLDDSSSNLANYHKQSLAQRLFSGARPPQEPETAAQWGFGYIYTIQ